MGSNFAHWKKYFVDKRSNHFEIISLQNELKIFFFLCAKFRQFIGAAFDLFKDFPSDWIIFIYVSNRIRLNDLMTFWISLAMVAAMASTSITMHGLGHTLWAILTRYTMFCSQTHASVIFFDLLDFSRYNVTNDYSNLRPFDMQLIYYKRFLMWKEKLI